MFDKDLRVLCIIQRLWVGEGPFPPDSRDSKKHVGAFGNLSPRGMQKGGSVGWLLSRPIPRAPKLRPQTFRGFGVLSGLEPEPLPAFLLRQSRETLNSFFGRPKSISQHLQLRADRPKVSQSVFAVGGCSRRGHVLKSRYFFMSHT